MIAVDRDPALNIKLVSDPPKGPAKFAKQATLGLNPGVKPRG